MLVLFTLSLLFAITCALFPRLRRLLIKTDLDNIPGPKSDTCFKGNFGRLFDPHSGWAFVDELFERCNVGNVVRIYGAFGSKHLYVSDVKAIHYIVVKDQDLFQETAAFFAHNSLAFGGGLLSSHGEIHKKQRKMLNPVFSTAQMRNMIPIFNDVARKLGATLKFKLTDGPQEIDILHWTGRSALEIIGQSALGYSFDPLVEGAQPHPFGIAAKEFSSATDDLLFLREYMLPTLIKIGSARFRRFVVDHLPWKKLRRFRDIVDTMDRVTTRIFEEKKKLVSSKIERDSESKDLMSVLMRANMAAIEKDRLPDKEVLAQMSTFAFAGTDTTSNAISRALHLLAHRPAAQERLREEVTQALSNCGGLDLPYDELVALPFLDAVCREILRLYPPITFVTRVATKNYDLPLSVPIEGIDGRQMSSILVPIHTKVFVSIYDINRDQALWGPDSLEWKPERWLSRLPQTVQDAHIPGAYSHLMTFLGGPRACIGFKFSELEMKVVLMRLISQFRFSPSDKDIFWEMTGITTPTVKGFPGRPQLPMMMELA